jgi:hypothetical protein
MLELLLTAGLGQRSEMPANHVAPSGKRPKSAAAERRELSRGAEAKGAKGATDNGVRLSRPSRSSAFAPDQVRR